MNVRVSPTLHGLGQVHLSESRRLATVLTGVTTLEALEAAEKAIDRMPSKTELKLAVRGLAKEARLARRAGTDLAIPAYAGGLS